MSYSFDQAADFYDATRAYPPDVTDKVTASILDLARPTSNTRILELGIGTGRISAPLIARGLRVWGIDLSREMMLRIAGKLPPGAVLRLVQANAALLPFASNTFPLALAVHVFHVIAPWRSAIGELRRVVGEGGLVLHSGHIRDPRSPNALLRNHLHELLEARGERWKRPGQTSPGQIQAEFRALGASIRKVEVARWTSPVTVQAELDALAHRVSTDTWAVSDEVLKETLAALTQWARGQYGRLDKPLTEENTFVWQVVRFDSSPLLPEPIRMALARIVPILDATGANWAVGGSCCLALHGVPVAPNDIDIITDREGAYRIGEALRWTGQEQQSVQWGEGEHIRSHRGIYRVADVQIDVVGASEWRQDNKWSPGWRPFEWKTDQLALPGTDRAVPAAPLQFELQAYRMMGRESKARLIEETLSRRSPAA